MGTLPGRRLVLLLPTVLGVVTLVFAFLHLLPGDPVEIMLGRCGATSASTGRSPPSTFASSGMPHAAISASRSPFALPSPA